MSMEICFCICSVCKIFNHFNIKGAEHGNVAFCGSCGTLGVYDKSINNVRKLFNEEVKWLKEDQEQFKVIQKLQEDFCFRKGLWG